MARSIPEIYNALVAEKEGLPTLEGLTGTTAPGLTPYQKLLDDVSSKSRVALWRLMLFIVAAGHWLLESLWDNFRVEVTAKADEAIAGNLDWYLRKVYEFQFGGDYIYELVAGKFQWSTIVPEDRPIQYAAVMELEGDLIIKVAKQIDGRPAKLETDVINAFTAYVSKFRIAGTKCQIISADADDLSYSLEIYFNPMRGFSKVKANVENAITEYLSTREFNGRFVVQRFVDYLQAADGVEDVVITTLEARYASLDLTPINRQYLPNAGYMAVMGGVALGTIVENTDRSYTTSNAAGVTIKYIPYV